MKSIIKIAILVVVAVAMVITNPKKAAHSEAIAAEYKESLQKKVGLLSALAGKKTLEKVVDSTVEVSDYVFVSVGKYSMAEGASGIVSVGLFNHVFVFTKDDLLQELGRSLGM